MLYSMRAIDPRSYKAEKRILLKINFTRPVGRVALWVSVVQGKKSERVRLFALMGNSFSGSGQIEVFKKMLTGSPLLLSPHFSLLHYFTACSLFSLICTDQNLTQSNSNIAFVEHQGWGSYFSKVGSSLEFLLWLSIFTDNLGGSTYCFSNSHITC